MLIEFSNLLHWKPAKKPKLGVVLGQKSKETGNIWFFSYFTWDYLLKQEAVTT